MVFALATDDGTLHTFQTGGDAIAYCEGIDVEEGVWLFFAADGSALEAEFLEPNKRGWISVVSGKYRLRAAPAKNPLHNHLQQIRCVRGSGLSSVEDLLRLLTRE